MVRIQRKIRYTLHSFIHDSRSVGVLLLVCTLISLLVSNLSFGAGYFKFWHLEIPGFHHLGLPHSVLHFINDGLMAVFFFLAGMEIKREMFQGELSSPKKAMLPVVAAISGVVVPAVIFLLFNKGTGMEHGWGIPTATDIAFSLGVAALLGKRVPYSLKVFLTALAIIDDLCAILIIALFYGGTVSWLWLGGSLVFTLAIVGLNKWWKKGGDALRLLFGIGLWWCMYHSGIHPTVAGIIFALLIPVDRLAYFEKKVHLPVNFLIVPIFALANTSILLPDNPAAVFASTVSWGIMLGLFIGKPLGILGACWMMIRRGWSRMPQGANWHQFIGVAILAGIGFTMSIFVASLAYKPAAWQDQAKLAVIIASFAAMAVGYGWLRLSGKNPATKENPTKKEKK